MSVILLKLDGVHQSAGVQECSTTSSCPSQTEIFPGGSRVYLPINVLLQNSSLSATTQLHTHRSGQDLSESNNSKSEYQTGSNPSSLNSSGTLVSV